MAFIAEDGTGLEDATSLCDVAFADSYFSDRGIAAWDNADETDDKKPALIKATDYIETRYGARFRGSLQFPDTPQALSFPRLYIGFDDVVPQGIKKAVAEYALRALTKPLVSDPVVDTTGAQVVGKKTKIGPIETELIYQPGTQVFVPYPAADMLVKPFLNSGGLIR